MRYLVLLPMIFFAARAATPQEEIVQDIVDFLTTSTEEGALYRLNTSFAQQIIQLPYSISTSGFYTLGTSLQGTMQSGGTGISITADNVILDLNNQTLSNLTTGITLSGRTNIYITNGSLQNMLSSGISIAGSSRNIVLENITINNSAAALVSVGTTNLYMSDCSFFNIRSSALTIRQTTNGIIQQCIANNNSNGANGFLLQNCSNIAIENCHANSNQGHGFYQENSSGISYDSCTANSNTLGGFSLNPNVLNTVNNANSYNQCTAEFNTAHGFLIRGNRTNLIGCQSQSNTTYGFTASGTGNVFFQCLAANNTLTGFIMYGNGAHLEQCMANNNGSGFILAAAASGLPISSNALVKNNSATGNSSFGFQNAGTPATTTPGGNRVYTNFANNNGTNFSGITNVTTSPLATTAINFTSNIAE